MTLFLLLLPAWVALAWAGLFGVVSWRTGGRVADLFGRWGGYLQTGILALFAAAVVAFGPLPEMDAGRWPFGWTLLIAAVSGPLLYLCELTVAVVLEAKMERRGAVYTLVEGGSKDLLKMPTGATSVLLLVVVLPIVEELLWRRALVPGLVGNWEMAPLVAVVVAGISFGLNHYWFGLRNVATKSVGGVVWGLLFLAGGLPAAVVAHISFQTCVWRRLSRMAHPRSITPAVTELHGSA
jgi:membrane protease YdiL (CAAX protease family)